RRRSGRSTSPRSRSGRSPGTCRCSDPGWAGGSLDLVSTRFAVVFGQDDDLRVRQGPNDAPPNRGTVAGSLNQTQFEHEVHDFTLSSWGEEMHPASDTPRYRLMFTPQRHRGFVGPVHIAEGLP